MRFAGAVRNLDQPRAARRDPKEKQPVLDSEKHFHEAFHGSGF
jgi:hypothetical protein